MANPEYLYHYTSLETLALILNHRTLAFNSLLNVDDVEEAETEDIANFGKYVYVSCWTDVEAESIAMWNLYTPDMKGVRIKLPSYPFKKHHYEAGQYHFTEAVDIYLNYDRLYKENECTITADLPKLFPVTYTRDKMWLMPKVRQGTKEDVQYILSLKSLSDAKKSTDVSYSFAALGKFKNEDWSFQREWRYWISMCPMGMQELYGPSPDEQFRKHQETIRRLEDTERKPTYNRFFMELDEECIKQMKVVLGPRTTEGGRILAHALLKEYGLEQNCRDSSLRIR